MKQYGSCNAQYFLVHDTTQRPYYAGTTFSSRDGAIEFFGKITENTSRMDIGVMRSRYATEEWGWTYENPLIKPQIQIVRQSDDTILYVWEADYWLDGLREDYDAILTTDPIRDVTIIPDGGSIVTCNMPSLPDLSRIEGYVQSAGIPLWILSTRFSDSTTTRLLQYLFNQEQSRLSLERRHNSISDALTHSYPPQIYNAFIITFMRSASRLLLSHYGQTCIPLLKHYFSCDSYGNIYQSLII